MCGRLRADLDASAAFAKAALPGGPHALSCAAGRLPLPAGPCGGPRSGCRDGAVRRSHARDGRGHPRRGGQALRGGAGAAAAAGRSASGPAREWRCAHVARLCRGLPRHCGRRLGGDRRQPRAWRHGPAHGGDDRRERDDVLGLPLASAQSAADAGPDRGAGASRLGCAEGALSAEAHLGGVVRHDEPDRAAGGVGRGRGAHAGRAAGGRHLCDHRAEDLHHLGRHGLQRERLPPRAGALAGRAAGHARDQPVPRAEVPARCRGPSRAAQCGDGGEPRGEAGPAWLSHRRHGL